MSGGSANTDPQQSLGAAKSSTQVTDNTLNNIFPNVTGAESTAGNTKFRCLYLHNADDTSLTFTNAKIWISQDSSSSNDEVDIGLGTSAINAQEQGPLTEGVAPSGVTFSHPTTEGAALVIGDIPAGQHKAFWLRRVVQAGAAAFTSDTFQIQVSGDTAA